MRLSLILTGLAYAAAAQAQQPNIVLFLVDDMGWQDTSVQFHSEATVWNGLYNTPNMERLAAQGMKFTDAYAASPVCSPTRVSIMTGQNPARSRISDWVGHGISENSYVRSPAWATAGLQPGDGNVTLPTILSASGYRTAHIGKGHFGSSGTAGANPLALGFDINIGGSHLGGPRGDGAQGKYFGPFPSSLHPNLEAHTEGVYMTDALTIEANMVISQAVADNVPFFINMAHYAVHAPLSGQGDPDFVGNYGDRPNPEDDYAAIVESMDASLGAVLDHLEAQGVADNTVVLFTSDNGGLSNHTRSNAGAPYIRDQHNSPLLSGKGAAYEGGIRVPMIVAWAGQDPLDVPLQPNLPIVPGSSSPAPVISDDLFTTILAVAGAEHTEVVDGHDLTPVLSGTGTRDGPLFFHYPHQWYSDIGVGPGIEPFSAIRDGDFKLIYFYGDGAADEIGPDPRIELYNLADDIGEENNLADAQPNRVRQLSGALVEYLLDVDAQVPVIRASGLPAELPDTVGNTPGDGNGDGVVDGVDYLIWAGNFGVPSTPGGDIRDGDFNFDGWVDGLDYLLWAGNFGQGPNDSVAVPEPTSITTALLALVGLLMVSGRWRG